ncbi:MAG: prolipoprotein diacylglyceryl transferase, partial [Bacteroides sp.]
MNYIIWNPSPIIFSYGMISLRWYGLLWVLGILLSSYI